MVGWIGGLVDWRVVSVDGFGRLVSHVGLVAWELGKCGIRGMGISNLL